MYNVQALEHFDRLLARVRSKAKIFGFYPIPAGLTISMSLRSEKGLQALSCLSPFKINQRAVASFSRWHFQGFTLLNLLCIPVCFTLSPILSKGLQMTASDPTFGSLVARSKSSVTQHRSNPLKDGESI
jgi:hypothetical protein